MLLSNVERFSVLVARSQSGNDSTEPVRISRPNIGELWFVCYTENHMHTHKSCIHACIKSIIDFALICLTAISAKLYDGSQKDELKKNLTFPQEEDLANYSFSAFVPAQISIPSEFLQERLSQQNGNR